MKKIVLFLLSVSVSCAAVAQSGITFKVEELSKPEYHLHEVSSKMIYKNLIMSDLGIDSRFAARDSTALPFDILCNSEMPDRLVGYG